MTKEERLADLKAKLKARTGMNEYRENVVKIRAEIARIERELKHE